MPKIIADDRWGEDIDEMYAWPRVIAIDPGGHTGVCVVWFDPEVLFDPSAPVVRSVVAWHARTIVDNENRQVQRIAEMVSELGGEGLAVVSESFVIRSLNQKEDFLSPVRIASKLDYLLWRGIKDWDGEKRRRGLYMQTPADAKTVITDARLKLWDMYTVGSDHSRDATRHGLLWIRRLKASGKDEFVKVHNWRNR